MEAFDDSSLSEAFGAPAGADDLLATVIAFANGDISPHWTRYAMPIKAKGGRELYAITGRITDADWAKVLEIAYETSEHGPLHARDIEDRIGPLLVDEAHARPRAEATIARERRGAVDALSQAAKGRGALLNWIRNPLARGGVRLRGLRKEPVLTDGSITWKVRGPRAGTKDWVLYAAIELLERTPDDVNVVVGKCQFANCGRFFQIVRGNVGKPQTKYHDEKCRLAEHGRMSAERQRKSRAARKGRVRRSK